MSHDEPAPTELYRQLSRFRLTSTSTLTIPTCPLSPRSPSSMFSDSESENGDEEGGEDDEDDDEEREDEVQAWKDLLARQQFRGFPAGSDRASADSNGRGYFDRRFSRNPSVLSKSTAASTVAPASPSNRFPGFPHRDSRASSRSSVGSSSARQAQQQAPKQHSQTTASHPQRPILVSAASCPSTRPVRPSMVSFPTFPRPAPPVAPDVFHGQEESHTTTHSRMISRSDPLVPENWRLEPVKLCVPLSIKQDDAAPRRHRREESSPLSRRVSKCSLRPSSPASMAKLGGPFTATEQTERNTNATAGLHLDRSEERSTPARATEPAGGLTIVLTGHRSSAHCGSAQEPERLSSDICPNGFSAADQTASSISPSSTTSCWATPLSGLGVDEMCPFPSMTKPGTAIEGLSVRLNKAAPDADANGGISPLVSPLMGNGPSIWEHEMHLSRRRSSNEGQEDDVWPSPKCGDLQPPLAVANHLLGPVATGPPSLRYAESTDSLYVQQGDHSVSQAHHGTHTLPSTASSDSVDTHSILTLVEDHLDQLRKVSVDSSLDPVKRKNAKSSLYAPRGSLTRPLSLCASYSCERSVGSANPNHSAALPTDHDKVDPVSAALPVTIPTIPTIPKRPRSGSYDAFDAAEDQKPSSAAMTRTTGDSGIALMDEPTARSLGNTGREVEAASLSPVRLSKADPPKRHALAALSPNARGGPLRSSCGSPCNLQEEKSFWVRDCELNATATCGSPALSENDRASELRKSRRGSRSTYRVLRARERDEGRCKGKTPLQAQMQPQPQWYSTSAAIL